MSDLEERVTKLEQRVQRAWWGLAVGTFIGGVIGISNLLHSITLYGWNLW